MKIKTKHRFELELGEDEILMLERALYLAAQKYNDEPRYVSPEEHLWAKVFNVVNNSGMEVLHG